MIRIEMSIVLATEGATCRGTWFVEYVPHEEPDFFDGRANRSCMTRYESITAQFGCRGFSLEELRLADYKEGHGGEHAERATQRSAMGSAMAMCYPLFMKDKRALGFLSLYVGLLNTSA
jgi:hypothetical protein